MHQLLARIPTGNGRPATVFENFTAHLFKKLFSPAEIDRPLIQVTSPNPAQRRDVILPVVAVTGFWHTLVFLHRGDLVLVECKNYAGTIGQDEIVTTAKYFNRPGLARFAFMIARNGISDPGRDAVREEFQVHGNFFCVLDETNLRALIGHLGNTVAATSYLRSIYQGQKARV